MWQSQVEIKIILLRIFDHIAEKKTVPQNFC